MSRFVWMPYETRPGALALEVEGVGISKALPGETVDLRDMVLSGHSGLALVLTVSLSENEVIPAVTAEGDKAWAVGVVVQSIPSRSRSLVKLSQTAEGQFRGTWEIVFDDVYREATLEPVLYRTEERHPGSSAGIATHRGAILADGRSVRVLFDYFPAPGNHWLRMTWGTVPEGKLFRVDTEEDSPFLVLSNDPALGLEALLKRRQRLPDHLRGLGNMVGSAIMAQATLELSTQTLFAITEAHAANPEQTNEEVRESLREWQLDVAKHWASEFQEGEVEDQVLSYIQDARDLSKVPTMVSQLFLAAQTSSDLSGRVREAKTEIESLEDDQ